MKKVIYVALLNEGVECWRPVNATFKEGDVYTINSKNPDLEDEHWEFSCGDDVRCKLNTFSGGSIGLVAYEKAS